MNIIAKQNRSYANNANNNYSDKNDNNTFVINSNDIVHESVTANLFKWSDDWTNEIVSMVLSKCHLLIP